MENYRLLSNELIRKVQILTNLDGTAKNYRTKLEQVDDDELVVGILYSNLPQTYTDENSKTIPYDYNTLNVGCTFFDYYYRNVPLSNTKNFTLDEIITAFNQVITDINKLVDKKLRNRYNLTPKDYYEIGYNNISRMFVRKYMEIKGNYTDVSKLHKLLDEERPLSLVFNINKNSKLLLWIRDFYTESISRVSPEICFGRTEDD